MTAAAEAVLERMQRNPSSPLYVTEIVQGCRHHDPSLTVAQILDGLNELHEFGYAIPATWRLTDQAESTPPPPVAAVPDPEPLAEVVQLATRRPHGHRRPASETAL